MGSQVGFSTASPQTVLTSIGLTIVYLNLDTLGRPQTSAAQYASGHPLGLAGGRYHPPVKMQHHSSRSQVCHSGGRDVTVEHMPAVVVEEKQHNKYSTRIVRDRLGSRVLQARRPLEEHDGSAVIEVGVGTLRLTTTEQLRPLHQLTGETFVRAWFQCVQGASLLGLLYVQLQFGVQC